MIENTKIFFKLMYKIMSYFFKMDYNIMAFIKRKFMGKRV